MPTRGPGNQPSFPPAPRPSSTPGRDESPWREYADPLPSTSHTHLNLTFEISLFSILRPRGRGFRRLSDCPGNADTPAVSNQIALTTVPEPPAAVPCHHEPVGPPCSLHIRNLTAPRGMLGEVRAAVCPEVDTYKSPKRMPSFHTEGPTGHDSAPPLTFSGEERYQGDLLEECSRLNGSPPKKNYVHLLPQTL